MAAAAADKKQISVYFCIILSINCFLSNWWCYLMCHKVAANSFSSTAKK